METPTILVCSVLQQRGAITPLTSSAYVTPAPICCFSQRRGPSAAPPWHRRLCTAPQPCSHLPVGSAAPAAATSPPPPLLTAGAGTHIQHPNPQRGCRAQCPGHGASSRCSSDTLQQASEQYTHAPSASAFVIFAATSTEKDQGAAVPHA